VSEIVIMMVRRQQRRRAKVGGTRVIADGKFQPSGISGEGHAFTVTAPTPSQRPTGSQT
jgi:hypothetical protein